MNIDHLPKKVVDFIRNHRLTILSTTSVGSDYPESALMYYLVDEHLDIFLITSKDSQKVTNITTHPQVALLISQEIQPIEVRIQGTAALVRDPSFKSALYDPYHRIANRNPQSLAFPPLTQLTLKQGVEVIHITIDNLKYSDFRQPSPVVYQYTRPEKTPPKTPRPITRHNKLVVNPKSK